MKPYIILSLVFSFTSLLYGCKDTSPKPLASLKVVNSIVEGPTARLAGTSVPIFNNGSASFAFEAGQNLLKVYPDADPSITYYNNSVDFAGGDVYSLYVTGTVGSPETLLIKETLPRQDVSTIGVRFCNLSPDSPLLNVSLVGSQGTNEVTNLAYKQSTEFKIYKPGSANSFDFQIKRSSDNVVLKQYTLNPIPRSTNITLVFTGKIGENFEVLRVNSDRP